MSLPRWQQRIVQVVDTAICRRNEAWGRAYATFLAEQAMRLDRAFGTSRARTPSEAARRRNPYRAAVHLLNALGYSQREIAGILKISQSAVCRLLRNRGGDRPC